MAHLERVVVLVDMDCFYCQVEEKLDPNLTGKPIAVVQYNAWKGGGIIAVNYPARDKGVTRHMRGDEAKEKCPDIELVRVPSIRGKADLTKYREAGKRVADVLQTFTSLLERASIDEAYLDITEVVSSKMEQLKMELTLDRLKNTHVVGSNTADFLYNIYNGDLTLENNLKLAIGGAITEEVRAAVFEKTGYKCSAGIAHNKILAKLACGLHKPNQQTILPHDSLNELYKELPVRKIKSLGGKFGNTLSEDLGIKFMGELAKFTEKELAQRYDEKTANWLYNIARGIDMEPVTIKLISKSIGCCKKFPGRSALRDLENVTHWLKELSDEMAERLEQDYGENNRKGRQMVVSFAQEIRRKDISSSRTTTLNSYDARKIQQDAYEVIKKHCLRPDGTFHIKFLGISVGKFEHCKKLNDISTFFLASSKTNDSEDVKSSKEINNRYIKSSKPKGIMAFLKKTERISNSTDTKNEEIIDTNHISEGIHCSNEPPVSERIDQEMQLQGMSNCDATLEGDDNLSAYSVETNELPSEYYDQFGELKYYKDFYDAATGFKLNQRPNQNNDIEKVTLIETDATNKNTDSIAADEDSIGNEIITSNPDVTRQSSSPVFNSFFMNYFEKLRNQSRDSPNTSRHLNDIEKSDSEEDNLQDENTTSENENSVDAIDQLHEALNKLNSTSESPCDVSDESNDSFRKENLPIGSHKSNLDSLIPNKKETNSKETLNFSSDTHLKDSTKDICPKCQKKVLNSEMSSHMDYHFALEIVRSESAMYKQPPRLPQQEQKNKNASTKNSKKRKLSDDSNTTKLMAFLNAKPQTALDENIVTEVCTECNKRIPLDDFMSHLDYHAAKKLHLEINVTKHAPPPQSALKNKPKSLISFFKQS